MLSCLAMIPFSAFGQREGWPPATSLEFILTQRFNNSGEEYTFQSSTGPNVDYRVVEQSSHSLLAGLLLRKEQLNGKYLTYGIRGISWEKHASTIFRFDRDNEVLEIIGLGETSTFEIGFRYERGRIIGHPAANQRVKISLGIFADPRFRTIKRVSFTPTGFPYRRHELGVELGPNFSLGWKVADRVRITVGVPMPVFRFDVAQIFFDNPLITEPERTNSEVNLDVDFRQIQLQFGLRVEL